VRPEIVDATDLDFARFFKTGTPDRWWKGQCIKKGSLVKAIAGVIEADEDGRIFVFMELRGIGRYPFMFRRVLRFILNVAEEHDIEEMFAFCDQRYPRAHEFLSRLGFKETTEEIDNQRVWIWQVSAHS